MDYLRVTCLRIKTSHSDKAYSSNGRACQFESRDASFFLGHETLLSLSSSSYKTHETWGILIALEREIDFQIRRIGSKNPVNLASFEASLVDFALKFNLSEGNGFGFCEGVYTKGSFGLGR